MILLSKKVIFSKLYNNLFAFKFIDDKLFSIEHCDTNNIVGNIYVGIVSDIVKNINAAFVGFAKGLKGYYLIDDNKHIYLNNKNTDKLCSGDRILVQVSADKVKTKEYTLTSNISLTGRYVVLTVGRTGINVSKKIKDNYLRDELKKSLVGFKNDEFGYILRTSCQAASIEIVIQEAQQLKLQWETLKNHAMHLTAGAVVRKNISDVTRIGLESINKEFNEILTDDIDVYQELADEEDIRNSKVLRIYEDKSYPMHKLYSLEKYLQDSLNKKVWLNSGAYLVIEPTESMTVIDVNTGKAAIKGNREKVFLQINLEAVARIACEIRRRNISGIIIIDFINMKDEENNKKMVEEMRRYTELDAITTTVVGLSNLGLMEITRKRTKKPLYEIIKKNHAD